MVWSLIPHHFCFNKIPFGIKCQVITNVNYVFICRFNTQV